MKSTLMSKLENIHTRTDVPAFLRDNCLNNVIIEVGVRFGYNFQQLISCNPKMAIAIDHWSTGEAKAEQDTGLDQKSLDKIYLDVCARFLNEHNVKMLKMRSNEASSIIPVMYADFIYLDADHTREGCNRDLHWWWPKVRQGGILAGHDYIDAKSKTGVPFGVIQAVNDFRKEKNIKDYNFHTTEEGYRSWFIYKEEGE